MQQNGYHWPGQQQPGQWPSSHAAPEPLRDCTALVLDGVWPHELMQPRPETARVAESLDLDLRKIVERTNEELAKLARLNLAPAEYRAAEDRFIRVAKSMAVLRVESTVRQLGGRSILGAQGMPRLTASPVQRQRTESDPLETTTVVSPEVIAEARRMAERRATEQPRVVPVVSPPYQAESSFDFERTQVFARHRVEEPESAHGAAAAAPSEPVIIDHVAEDSDRPPAPTADAGDAAAPRRPDTSVGREQQWPDSSDGMTTEPVAARWNHRSEPVGQWATWPEDSGAGAGRHREPSEPQAPAEPPRERPGEAAQAARGGQAAPVPPAAPAALSREPLQRPYRFGEPSLLPAPPARPVNGAQPRTVKGHAPEPAAPSAHERREHALREQAPREQAPPRPSRPLAIEQPVSLQQMVGSLARQQPSLKWLVAERVDGSKVAVCDVLSGWIPPGIALPAGVTVLAPEQRSGRMEDWVGEVTASARYGPGNRIEGRNVSSVAGEEAFEVVDIVADLGDRVAEATNRPGLPRIANTLVRATVSGSGVLPAELDVLNVHLETAVQMLLAEAPDVNADEAVSCMLMGAAAAIAAGRATVAAYHYGWFEAIAGRR